MEIPIAPELEALLKVQRKAFKKKFGRYPKPNEPIFFDPDADTLQALRPEKMAAETLAAMKAAGTPAEIIYAYKTTGRLLDEERRHKYPAEVAEALAEWDAAIREYRRLEEERAAISDIRSHPRKRRVPPTDIPELQASPYTDEDKDAIFKCLDAVDVVLAVTPMTVRARLEVGAALVALAADAAYDSAIDQGKTVEEALDRAAIFGSLAVDRAQEIFDDILRNEDE